MEFRLNWLFGITSIPLEKMELPFVFGNEPPFIIKVKDRNQKTIKFKVSFRPYGKSEAEKLEIKRHFLPDYEPQEIPSPISLEIAFRCDAENRNFNEKSIEKKLINYLPEIKRAVGKFYDAYRKLIFIKQVNDGESIKEVAFTLKRNIPLSFKELKTFLFYEVSFRRKTVRGVISEGEGASMGNLQKSEMKTFKNFIKRGQSLPENWLFAGYVSYYEERYGEAVISAAIALESAISLWLKTKLGNKHLTPSEIDKLIDNASKRDVLPIIFKILKRNIDENQIPDIKKTFEIRNSLVHGKRKHTKSREAEKALDTSLNLLRSLGYF